MKFNKVLENIQTYEAGKPIELVVREFGIAPKDVVKLASNENPIGTNPAITKVIRSNADIAHLYPDDSMFELKEALSRKFDVEDENIIIGAGSDQVLEFISRALLNEASSVLMSAVTFAMYEIYAKQMGAKIIRTESYEHKYDEFIEAYHTYKPKIIYICTPNNPTGDATSREEVLKIIEGVDKDTLVVVDGAYMEYAAAKDQKHAIAPTDLLKYENVIYLGTFSKAHGLGGMRVGYGIAQAKLIKELYKMRPPFNITTLSLLVAIEACKDDSFVEASIALHQEQIKRYETFAKENGISYIESYTNFITYLFDENLDSTQISDALLKRGVIIRNLASYGMNGVRITIGTEVQNDVFFRHFAEVIS
ncbi:histidinol-phosphate transaminase [Sulfurovum sp. NBC37-1]|uniref:Histidinol-phosphate aminotransferase n=1 Tax=Sulfurovum sp. (strain NBC37-1) TaxID=387093 RepID=HIS8_SULNB|nr:histidinol-phosphate transaminase [Sulfurovum sp. NBC37-1]A6QBY8.1 RecName: Full=Histidinol-phosphate aminotransferase; AltName: Full=Imidazole acetol-phosphate transaminase [Sulfurovum sp. NBC37-1]BAF72997.1 histidinol-phosphate aminotransferase [Sulfurovum sp. NBC37-1]